MSAAREQSAGVEARVVPATAPRSQSGHGPAVTLQGKPLDAEERKGAAVRIRVLTGGKSPAALQRAALALTEVLPQADHRTLPGLDHGAVVMVPRRIAPEITEFIKG